MNLTFFVIPCLGLLYAVGGYDGASRQCLSTVECYSATANDWERLKAGGEGDDRG